MNQHTVAAGVSRRRFLKTAAGAAVSTAVLSPLRGSSAAETEAEPFLFGVVTDVHYADAPPQGSRHYRDSLAKLTEAVQTFKRLKLPFVIELGDFIDAGPTKADELGFLRAIDEVYQRFRGERYYVLGNHCLASLTKDEFLANCGARIRKSYYSFDRGRFHFVVLDGNFKRDGSAYAAGNFLWTDTWIHQPQLQWLADDLNQAGDRRTFVLVHQILHDENDPHGVKNAPDVRRVLEAADNVLAVLQGHMHTGGYTKINGIPYCTLKAMVEGPALENNAYGVVTVDPSDAVKLEGFGRQGDVAFA